MMRHFRKIVPAALAFSLAVVPFSSLAAEPGQKYDDATLARLQDNTLEYDEIEMLIDEYNPTLKNLWDTYHDNKNSYKSVSKLKEQVISGAGALLEQSQELAGTAGMFKDMLGKTDMVTPKTYADLLYSSELLDQKAEQMALSADSLTEMTPDMLKIKVVDTARMGLISGAQSAMIGYQQLLLQRESLEDSIGLLQEVYASTQRQANVQMATANDVLAAKKNLESAQAGLLTIDINLEKIRQSLCTMMGWQYNDHPDIQAVPTSDLSRIERMNPEADKQAAIDNNLTLRYNRLDYENLTPGSVEQINLARTIEQEQDTVASSLKNLYNDVLQKRNEYETAVSAYELEQTKMHAADLKLQVQTISKLQYRQQQNALKSKEVAMKNADLALFQAMETYDWAIEGNLTI